MLNWTIVWVGVFLFGLGGPLQNDTQESVPVSNDVLESAKLHVCWGDSLLQGLHIGFFIAIGALVVYWIILNRTTLGYGVKAVGLQPRGGALRRHQRRAQLLPRDGDLRRVRGPRGRDRHPRLAVPALDRRRRRRRRSASSGIAVALLGRNTAVGTGLAALLFGALLTGTSTRNLDPSIFQPELASNLTLLIQGLVVLFVGLDMVILCAARAGAETEGRRHDERRAPAATGRQRLAEARLGRHRPGPASRRSSPCRRSPRAPGCRACCSASSRCCRASSSSPGARSASAGTRWPRRCSASGSRTSRLARRSASSRRSSSGRRSSRRCSATRRRSSSARSAACSRSARASSTSASRG